MSVNTNKFAANLAAHTVVFAEAFEAYEAQASKAKEAEKGLLGARYTPGEPAAEREFHAAGAKAEEAWNLLLRRSRSLVLIANQIKNEMKL